MIHARRTTLLLVLAAALPAAAFAQKKPLTQADWDRWQSIASPALSPDGQWAAYMCTYNGEPHGIQGRANQKDFATRMQTFFDVKLKGAPEPDWMQKGIAAKDKGKDQVAPVIRP